MWRRHANSTVLQPRTGISQSKAATQHIQELERRLGVQMLDRSTRSSELTQAGKLYAELCRDVLRREEEDFVVALDGVKSEAEDGAVASIYSIRTFDGAAPRGVRSGLPRARSFRSSYSRPDKVARGDPRR